MNTGSKHTTETNATAPTRIVDPRLDGFTIERKSSTNIDYFGSNRATGQMFFQFRNGTSYIYNGIPVDVMKAASGCESIGKFFFALCEGQRRVDWHC